MLADKSILQHFFLARRLSWPMALSLSLHASLIAALLYASYHEVRPQPVSQPGPINAIMVNPAMFAMAGAAASARPGASSSTSGEPTAVTPPAPQAQQKTMLPEQDARPEKTPVNASPAPTRTVSPAPTRPESVPRAAPALEKPKPQRQERAHRSAPPSVVAPAKASPHETPPSTPRPAVSAPQSAALTSAPPSSRAGAMTSADQAPQSGASGEARRAPRRIIMPPRRRRSAAGSRSTRRAHWRYTSRGGLMSASMSTARGESIMCAS